MFTKNLKSSSYFRKLEKDALHQPVYKCQIRNQWVLWGKDSWFYFFIYTSFTHILA